MGKAHVLKTIDIEAPIEFVFERLVDHEAMSDWPGISSCRLTREGDPRNGLGAVRAVKMRGLTLLEEIVHYEPPVRYDYTITKGLPVDHLGTVTLEPIGAGTRITWNINMTSGWPLVCGVVGHTIDRGFPEALEYFKRETEAAANQVNAA